MSDQIGEFICKYSNCHRKYSSKYNLRRHIESNHSKAKRFRCRNCGKYLSSKQNLQEHMYTHSRSKPYVCPEPNCKKSFRQSSQLSNHKNLHKELIAFYRQQNQFKELKLNSSQLNDIFRQQLEVSQSIGVKTDETSAFLPSISGPQFFVVLPSLF